METYIIDPRNTAKPYNFGFLWSLKRKNYPFTFLGYIPKSWRGNSPVKENNPFLPISRGIFENKRIQRFIGNFTQTLEIFFGYLRLRARLKEPSIIHFLWFTSPSIEQHLIPKINHARLLHTAHNLLPHRDKISDFEKFRKLYSCMKYVVVHDKESTTKFKGMFKIKTNVCVIPHGNLENFYNTFDITNRRESEVFYSQMLEKLKRPIFLFIGPVKSYKGFEILLRAAKILNEKGYTYSLVIKDKKHFQMKNIYYLPIEVPYSKLGLIYRNADVVILPHTKISQSVTLFEAGYFEKAVIVSSAGGFKETVRDRLDGFVFNNGVPENLAEKMERLIQSGNEWISMGRNFKEILIREYSWDTIVDKWIKLYEETAYP